MRWVRAISLWCLAAIPSGAWAVVPYGQTKEPGPALSPQQAMAKMELPPGFKVTLVASEPDIVNPTSFTFDDRGRIWITESVEYPRESAGPGRDRVKILESTNNDGHFDRITIFKDGLNIPCGVVIGNGGAYVTNSPDILFLQDTKADGKADQQTVILSGFGRYDRHELPNSLTWGPDGWLYGMNGVFNEARVQHDGQTFDFTCALWRWHPKTHKFELFAQGTSNPWGLDYNRQGDWFLSCCVIDHLFHVTQSGYYLRQGGPYPPQTHWLPSITTARHQAAAYAGVCIYDADQFPQEYRGTLFMGNLHGSAINRDTLTRKGSTYVQHNAPDFLQANDAWFMPVSQKVGPDGCLYVIDWYDRYHCYQDAGRDPEGIDRSKGRIYRISHGDPPRIPAFDLQKMSTMELLKLLSSPNVWWRRQAMRVLNEKFDASMVPTLQRMALDTSEGSPAHMHAMWLLIGQHQIDPAFHLKLLNSEDEPTRNWGVRAAGELGKVEAAILEKLKSLATDPSPDVRAQLAVAAGRLRQQDGLPILLALLHNDQNANDPLIPTLVYNNLKPVLESRGNEVLGLLENDTAIQNAFGQTTARWARDAVNALNRRPDQVVADLAKTLARYEGKLDDTSDERHVRNSLQSVIDTFNSAGLKPGQAADLFDSQSRQQVVRLAASRYEARLPATLIALWWNDPTAVETARSVIADNHADASVRGEFVRAMGRQKSPANIPAFASLVGDNGAPILIRENAVRALGQMDDPNAAEALLSRFDQLPNDLRPMVINAMVLSRSSAKALLDTIRDKKIPLSNMNVNHARAIYGLNDPELSKEVAAVWGTIRTERNPQRAKLVEEYKKLFLKRGGDTVRGQKVFEGKCAQCHTIYGRGGNIGPDITGVGRDNLDLVLSNVLDPNLVVGAPYYVNIAKLKNGTVVSGLLVEDSPKQIVLKDPTGTTTIPRDQLEKLSRQNISMMPEGLEGTMSKDEFCDLIAFLLTRDPPPAK